MIEKTCMEMIKEYPKIEVFDSSVNINMFAFKKYIENKINDWVYRLFSQ